MIVGGVGQLYRAICLARGLRTARADLRLELVLFDSPTGEAWAPRLIDAAKRRLWDSVETLPTLEPISRNGWQSARSLLRNRIVIHGHRQFAMRLSRTARPASLLLVFKDNDPINMTLLSVCRRDGMGTVLVEEGQAIYHDDEPPIPATWYWLKRIVGYPVTRTRAVGASRLAEWLACSDPSRVPASKSGLFQRVLRVPDAPVQEAFGDLGEIFGFQWPVSERSWSGAIYASQPLSEEGMLSAAEEASFLTRLAQACRTAGCPLKIKPHPREDAAKFASIPTEDVTGARFSQVPVELLFRVLPSSRLLTAFSSAGEEAVRVDERRVRFVYPLAFGDSHRSRKLDGVLAGHPITRSWDELERFLREPMVDFGSSSTRGTAATDWADFADALLPSRSRILPIAGCSEDALAAFFQELLEHGDDQWFLPHPLDAAHARQLVGHAGRDYYCAMLDGQKIVAYGMLRGWDEGYEVPRLGIAVGPAARRAGIGSALMQHLHREAALRGASRVQLRTHESNAAAISLYRKTGYRVTGREEDMLIMDLDPLPEIQPSPSRMRS